MASTATSTATETTATARHAASEVPAAPAPPAGNPKDSMKSTWRADKERKGWGYYHKIIVRRGMYHQTIGKPLPVHKKTDKVPYIPEWQVHRWILYHAAIPLIIHQAFIYYTGWTVHPLAAIPFYAVMFNLIGIHQLNVMRRMAHRYGFLDGDVHERDDVPDHSVTKTVLSLVATTGLRQVMSVLLAYKSSEGPLTMDWLALPFEIGLYGVVLDFWYYLFHRTIHQFDSFWKYHRTHHLTKRPTALLTLYADAEQEFFDIIGVPLLTYLSMKFMGLPMGFYEWWVCHQYVVWTELCGHSGLRVCVNTPSTISWLLKYFNVELVIEDHDLHHRKGWKKSHNYGKQTRIWDTLFGTCHDRIELVPENIDYENPGEWPIFI